MWRRRLRQRAGAGRLEGMTAAAILLEQGLACAGVAARRPHAGRHDRQRVAARLADRLPQSGSAVDDEQHGAVEIEASLA